MFSSMIKDTFVTLASALKARPLDVIEEDSDENFTKLVINIIFIVVYGMEILSLFFTSCNIFKYSQNRTLGNTLMVVFIALIILSNKKRYLNYV